MTLPLSPQRHDDASAPGRSAKGHLQPSTESPHGLARVHHSTVAPNLEQIMRQAYQTPCPTDVLQATQQEAATPPHCFDLAKHRLHDDLASGIYCLAFRRPHFRRHALLRGGGRVVRLGFQRVVLLAPQGYVRIKPSVLQRLHGRLTVIAIVQGRREQWDVPRFVLWRLHAGLRQSGQGGLRQRCRLLCVIRGVGHVAG